MIVRASGLGIIIGRISRLLRGVGVIAMPTARMDATRCIEVPPAAGVLLLPVPAVLVGVFNDRHCLADRVEVFTGVLNPNN